AERRDLDRDDVARDRGGPRVPRVGEVGQEDGRPLPRRPAEELLVEGERVLEAAGDVRGEVRLRRLEVDEPQVLRLGSGELGRGGGGGGGGRGGGGRAGRRGGGGGGEGGGGGGGGEVRVGGGRAELRVGDGGGELRVGDGGGELRIGDGGLHLRIVDRRGELR